MMYLRRNADGADPNSGIKSGIGPSESAQLLRLRLGDEEAISMELKSARDFYAKYGKASVGSSKGLKWAKPSLIPELAKDFVAEDGNEIGFEDTGDLATEDPPLSVSSALFAIGIIKGSPAFDPTVREWAQTTYDTIGYWKYTKHSSIPANRP